MARRVVVRHAPTVRRKTAWLQFAFATTVIPASSDVLLFTLNAAALALRPFTIVRTRGFMQVHSDQAAVTEEYGVSMGLAIVSDQASAIGITAVPSPVSDMGSDLFFLFETLGGRIEFLSSVGLTEVGMMRDIDSKAMRKVAIGQDLAVVASATGAVGNRLYTGFRMLVKLH